MTRWARANNVHRNKASEATPWSQLRRGGRRRTNDADGSTKSHGSEREHLRRTLPPGPGSSKKAHRKKEYSGEDVNGFMAFLQQSGQLEPNTERAARSNEADFTAEVEAAVKQDQRREHRRIKRQNDKKNKMLCFNCRKPGHGLSDCPEADRDEEMGRGICYRCGSTEHEIHKCRAKIDPALGEFPFAKCFICGQTGHLSRSCPDNPKGLYAQGGSCRICGSVEHFQKDCPEHQAATNTMTLKWLSNNMSADHEDVHVPVKKDKPKQSKVVVF